MKLAEEDTTERSTIRFTWFLVVGQLLRTAQRVAKTPPIRRIFDGGNHPSQVEVQQSQDHIPPHRHPVTRLIGPKHVETADHHRCGQKPCPPHRRYSSNSL